MTKKPFVFFIIFIASVSCLYAEAPELKNVMPNSWRKITRLNRDEEIKFLRNNAGLLEKSVREGVRQAESSLLGNNKNIEGTTLVYYEPVGEEKFYRLITVNSDTDDFSKQREIQFLQTLAYEFRGRMEILAIGSYNASVTSDGEIPKFVICKSFDIIRSGGRAKGILTTHLEIPFNITYTHIILEKGQPFGINRSAYALMDDIKNVLAKGNGISARLDERGLYLYEGLSYIDINASDCLVDPNIPLRYSLQNAFDGDPATSYVENTENDLIKMEFSEIFRLGYINKIAIINGYAQEINIYMNNNRVKKISRGNDEVPLKDGFLSYQFIETPGKPQFVIVTDIYKGKRYNDTCLAELNVKTDKGWLFGDINE